MKYSLKLDSFKKFGFFAKLHDKFNRNFCDNGISKMKVVCYIITAVITTLLRYRNLGFVSKFVHLSHKTQLNRGIKLVYIIM